MVDLEYDKKMFDCVTKVNHKLFQFGDKQMVFMIHEKFNKIVEILTNKEHKISLGDILVEIQNISMDIMDLEIISNSYDKKVELITRKLREEIEYYKRNDNGRF